MAPLGGRGDCRRGGVLHYYWQVSWGSSVIGVIRVVVVVNVIDIVILTNLSYRIKEILITAGGENVPPFIIEDMVRQEKGKGAKGKETKRKEEKGKEENGMEENGKEEKDNEEKGKEVMVEYRE